MYESIQSERDSLSSSYNCLNSLDRLFNSSSSIDSAKFDEKSTAISSSTFPTIAPPSSVGVISAPISSTNETFVGDSSSIIASPATIGFSTAIT